MEAAWPSTRIAYSFKTNYDVARTGVFRDMGAFAEVVSAREYTLAETLGYDGGEIIYNGPFKNEESLRAAMADNAFINVNDQRELELVVRLAGSLGRRTPIGIRLSSTLGPFGHSRFGFSMENGEAELAVKTILRSDLVELAGLHSHVYGDTDDEGIHALASRRAAEFARKTVPDFHRTIRIVNMGGGFPANTPKPYSRKSWRPREIGAYVRAITGSLRKVFERSEDAPTLILEPGRYLVNDAVALLTEVVHVLERNGKQLVNTNGSISMVPLTHYRPQLIRAYDRDLKPRPEAPHPTVIYGATCRENDVLFDGEFGRVIPGDFLIHFGVGAYNSSLSPAFIFDPPSMFVL
jgi:diaminopimelate decarboxylase